LKLITPPLWPLSLSWTVHSEVGPIVPALSASESELPAEPADTVSHGELTAERDNDVSEEIAEPVAPHAESLCAMPCPLASSPPPNAGTLPPISHPATTATSFRFSWQWFLGSVWLSGSVGWLALAGYRVQRFHRLLRFTEQAPENLQSRARLLA